jgi:enterochelin esterase family protein
MRIERAERRRAAHVRDPGPGVDRPCDVRDRAVGDAEQDELRLLVAHGDASLREPGGDRQADASRADNSNTFDQRKLQFRVGYRATTVYVVPRAVRTTYGFLPDPPAELESCPELWYAIRPDPLNPATFVFPGDEEDPGFERTAVRSVLEGPDAPSNRAVEERPGIPRGTCRLKRFPSAVLGNERRVWLYTPAGHDATAAPYPLLVVFDGWAYDEPFLSFLTDELLPWARRELHGTDDARRTIAAGSSAGGLSAAFAVYRRPDVFGNVLSQSGAFWYGRGGEDAHEWLTNRLAESARLPVRFYLDAGLFETGQPPEPGAPSILKANRRLRDLLVERGYELHYAEFAGGHDYICWQTTLADGHARSRPSRRRRFARTAGQSSSMTAYQAESRFSPPRTSMCLRNTPSNSAGSAASAARERSFRASVLNSTRRAPSRSKACSSMSSFASAFAPVLQAARASHVHPISSTRCSGRSSR